MSKYVILVNGGAVGGGTVFSMEGLVKEFKKWSDGEVMKDEEGEEVSIEDLIEAGSCGEKIEVYNESMVEMGDDYVELSIIKLNEGEEYVDEEDFDDEDVEDEE